MKIEDIVKSLRCISTGGDKDLHCENCPFLATEPISAEIAEMIGVNEWESCDCDAVGLAAVDLIEKLLDRCARYAEEIAVLQERQRWIPVTERLPEDGDTGLTPEEVAALQKDWSDLCTTIGECGGLDRVKELAEADKEGRVVVLPCKVGDTVWAILDSKKPSCECKVAFVNIGGFGTTIVLEGRDRLREQYGVVAAAFGKTAFFTREEAEEALRRAENDTN